MCEPRSWACRRPSSITGGTAGVGRTTAEAFARLGCRISLVARDVDRLSATRKVLLSLGAEEVEICAADLAEAAAVDKAATHFERRLGPVDVWVNNVMTTVFAAVDQISAEEFRRVTAITYLGQTYGTMAALRYMRPRGRGAIIQVGSPASATARCRCNRPVAAPSMPFAASPTG